MRACNYFWVVSDADCELAAACSSVDGNGEKAPAYVKVSAFVVSHPAMVADESAKMPNAEAAELLDFVAIKADEVAAEIMATAEGEVTAIREAKGYEHADGVAVVSDPALIAALRADGRDIPALVIQPIDATDDEVKELRELGHLVLPHVSGAEG